MSEHLNIVKGTISNMLNKLQEHQEGKLTKEELYLELINRMIKIDMWLRDYADGE